MTYAPGFGGNVGGSAFIPVGPTVAVAPQGLDYGQSFNVLGAIRRGFSAAGMAVALRRAAVSLVGFIAPSAAKKAAEHILNVANRTVPYDTGALMRSGRVVRGSRRGHWVIEYTEDYAQIQHENLEFRHDYPRRAKWLELTFREQRGVLAAAVGRNIQSGLANNLGGAPVGGRLQGFVGSTYVGGV